MAYSPPIIRAGERSGWITSVGSDPRALILLITWLHCNVALQKGWLENSGFWAAGIPVLR